MLKQFLWPPNVKKCSAPIIFIFGLFEAISGFTPWLRTSLKIYLCSVYLIALVVSYIISVLIHAYQEIKRLSGNNIGLQKQYKENLKEIERLKRYSKEDQQNIISIFTLLGEIKQEIQHLEDKNNGKSN